MSEQKLREALQAAKHMDWHQVVLNGGPPCFHLEEGRFCGRAQRWEGHGYAHKFISLDALLSTTPPQPTSDEGTPVEISALRATARVLQVKGDEYTAALLNQAADTLHAKRAIYVCKTHGEWDAYRASGCPDCMVDARRQLHAKERELGQLRELIELAKNYRGIEAHACPLCTYENGKFVKYCEPHRQLEETKHQLAALPSGYVQVPQNKLQGWIDAIRHRNELDGADGFEDYVLLEMEQVATPTPSGPVAPQSGKKEDGPQLPEFDDLPDDVREEMEMVLYTTVSDEDHFGSEVAERIYGIVREVMLKRRLLLRQEWVKNVTSSDEDEPSVLGVPTPPSPPSKAEGE